MPELIRILLLHRAPLCNDLVLLGPENLPPRGHIVRVLDERGKNAFVEVEIIKHVEARDAFLARVGERDGVEAEVEVRGRAHGEREALQTEGCAADARAEGGEVCAVQRVVAEEDDEKEARREPREEGKDLLACGRHGALELELERELKQGGGAGELHLGRV